MNILLRFVFFLLLFSAAFITNGQQLDTRQAPLPCVDKTFSVVAHIVLDSMGNPNITEAEIMEAVDSANSAFAPICIRFNICEFRIIPNFQYDMLDRQTTEWDELQVKYHVARRINMFFVSDFGADQPYLCGFAGLSGITRLNAGGIVIKKGDCIAPSSSTVTHELGHYFGLLHTFEGDREELVNASNCATTGDLICDTPADPFMVGDMVSDYVDEAEGCRFILRLTDNNGEWYAPHVGNYMSYYPDGCSCGFTHQQYLRMANTFLNSPDKMW